MNIESVQLFFLDIARGNPNVIDLVNSGENEGMQMIDGQLMFTLPALHKLLDCEQSLSYPAFRQLIYSSRLNDCLSAQGYQVQISQNHGKVDKNIYCLNAADGPE